MRKCETQRVQNGNTADTSVRCQTHLVDPSLVWFRFFSPFHAILQFALFPRRECNLTAIVLSFHPGRVAGMGGTVSKISNRFLFIPPPTYHPRDLPDQTNRIHIVTGGYGGIGLELAKALYAKNATIYILGRDSVKASAAIALLKDSGSAGSAGRVEFIGCDLADLATIKPAAEEFMRRESSLHVLTNSAGVFLPPRGILTAQGHDMQIGVNCLGHFVLTMCLLPILQRTAEAASSTGQAGSVRVTWASSVAVDVGSPKGGIVWDSDNTMGGPDFSSPVANYTQSKVGMLFLAQEMAMRYGEKADPSRRGRGVVSVAWDPGNVASDLGRYVPWLVWRLMKMTYLYPVAMGVHSPLLAGWSEEARAMYDDEDNGDMVIAWGRLANVRADVRRNLKRKVDGGDGGAERFWKWCEEMTAEFI